MENAHFWSQPQAGAEELQVFEHGRGLHFSDSQLPPCIIQHNF